jgi:thiol-disulfide isomerase/thioredoxin
MGDSIALGPLLLPLQAVLLVLATALALGLLSLLPEAPGAPRKRAETRLFWVLASGVIGARLGWVGLHWQAYAATPGAVLAFRDGGYSPVIGLICAATLLVLSAVRAGVPRRESSDADAVPSSLDHLRMARRQLLLPGAAALLLIVLGQAGLALRAAVDAQPLPRLTLRTLDGAAYAFPPSPGRPQVINLWASWCGPCRREMPAFARVQAQRPDVDFVYLNIGERREEIDAFVRSLQQPLAPIVLDVDAQLPAQIALRGYPTTLFIDAAGRLQRVRSGELSEASLQALLPAPPSD